MNKETFEEAGVAYAKTVNENHTSHMLGFYDGAKWEQEQNKKIYSEEQVLKILENYDREFKLDTFAYTKPCTFTVKEWFEQYKNKS